MAEGDGLLNRYTVLKLYRGFESLPLRHRSCDRPTVGRKSDWIVDSKGRALSPVATERRPRPQRGESLPLRQAIAVDIRWQFLVTRLCSQYVLYYLNVSTIVTVTRYMPHVILLRHGKSTWNEKGLWTGHTDVDLAESGRQEARLAAEAIRDIAIHKIHVSDLKRAQQTMDEVKKTLGIEHLPHKIHPAIKERHYGDFTGQNKWEIKAKVGDAEFQRLRRGWDAPIPNGETLKDVYLRASAYYDEYIKPELAAGHNVLIVAHGNSLRAIAKHIENLSEEAIAALEIGTGEVHCYELDAQGNMIAKEIRAANENVGKV